MNTPSQVELRTTFLPVHRAETSIQPFLGVWTQGDGNLKLMLAPRTATVGGGDRSHVFGTVPEGQHEGVFELSRRDNVDALGRLLLYGRHVAAQSRLAERPTIVVALNPGEIELQIEGTPPQRLSRVADVNKALLDVAIIGHRGLSLGQPALMNSHMAFERAFQFGCSGVEFDVVVPFESTSSGRLPRASSLRVMHPPEIWSEISNFDSVSTNDAKGAPTVDQVLDKVGQAGLTIVYIDPKLRWLFPANTAASTDALSRLWAIGQSFVDRYPNSTVMIAAEKIGPGETADILKSLVAADEPDARVTWTPEFTRGSDEPRYRAYASGAGGGNAPGVLSWSLLRLKGAGQGALGWLLTDLTEADEEFYRGLAQPFVFWTAVSDAQFDAAMAAARRLDGVAPRNIAIITPYPHRLAYFLATVPSRLSAQV